MIKDIHQDLISLLYEIDKAELDLIPWGAPVPYFGDLSDSKLATIGLNPSDKEFVDSKGFELDGNDRRFHTLNSLGINDWSKVLPDQVDLISGSCDNYFYGNPYDNWFRVLDKIISGTGCSYYSGLFGKACHIDLVPFATSKKWSELSVAQQNKLCDLSKNILALMLKESSVKVVVLNGKTVVNSFEKMSDVVLDKTEMVSWGLPRKNGKAVKGYAYKGMMSAVSGIDLGKELLVLGFNHNIQSSFGVTNITKQNIAEWISVCGKGELLNECKTERSKN